MGALFTTVLLAAVLAWLLAPGRARAPAPDDPVEPPEADELEAAEREVRDLDLHQRPEEGFQGDDWGPGAGGPPTR
ncbi:MAG: hypothetical protein IPJ95_14815 [Gemmatimonadetes bacterium]|nr:hypothetical protein [Gemmatimonadota bacterium]MBK6778380.1 hypothetical protein [Gemmatimonadota bacterium]MBK7924872.1 hypothetical protein [Gemmatimonadota bacterium]MBK9068014.1 hypothetical protein [Gemmatimonadota bacterium]